MVVVDRGIENAIRSLRKVRDAERLVSDAARHEFFESPGQRRRRKRDAARSRMKRDQGPVTH